MLRTVKNARRAIDLLGSAQMKREPYPEPVEAAPRIEPGQRTFGPESDKTEIRSFNSGYLDAIGPDVDVALRRQITLLPLRMLVLPNLL